MKRIIASLLALALLCGCFAACGKKDPDAQTSTEPAVPATTAPLSVTAYDIGSLAGTNSKIVMCTVTSDGWIMIVAMNPIFDYADNKIGGMAFEPVSDDVFRWVPSEESLSEEDAAENPNTEMRILYSDPDGRFIVYGPNVENPDLANIIINPDHFGEIANEEKQELTENYNFFYPIIDEGLLRFLKTMPKLYTRSDYEGKGE